MLPERVRTDCNIVRRWKVDARLWQMVLSLDAWASTEFKKVGVPYPGIVLFSAFRTASHNRSVGGVPNSRHLTCPSTAVDLQFGSVAGVSSPQILGWLGARWISLGGRWGGTFAEPSPNHFDLG